MTERKENDASEAGSLQRLGNELWGIVFLACAILALISLISHFINGQQYNNILGRYIGTYFSRGLIALVGELAAFAFPLLVGWVGVLRIASRTLNAKRWIAALVFTLEVCTLLAISGRPLSLGEPNAIGRFFAFLLQKIFGQNPFGPYFVISIAILITAMAGFDVDVGRLVRSLIEKMRLWFPRLRHLGTTPMAKVSSSTSDDAKAQPATATAASPRKARARASAQQGEVSLEETSAARAEPASTPQEEATILLEKQRAEFRAKKNKPITITTADASATPVEPETTSEEPAEAESAALARAAAELAAEEEARKAGAAEEQTASAEPPEDYYKVPQDEESRRRRRTPSRPYQLPSPDVIRDPPPYSAFINKEEIEKNSLTLEKTLLNFGLEGKVVNVSPGPIITRYEIELAPGIKVSRVVNLQDDISLAVGGQKIRIQAPIPGKAAIGIELPNENRQVVHFKHILVSDAFTKSKAKIPVVLGRSISGAPFVCDIAKMPHVLIAGQTGSGKSVCINSFICSMLMTKTPEELRLIMVDPKKVELSYFAGIPHLLAPVVTETKEAVRALRWGQEEMERRYRLFAKVGARNIESFNNKVVSGSIRPGSIPEADNKALPFIVIIVDELADLMITAPKDVEASIQRIAQMARAVGIHLIVATQRPSVDIITGRIKANLTSRIAFRTIQATDSRTILEHPGSEKLLGMGDMLFLRSGAPDIERCHGAFISEEDVEAIVGEIKKQNYEVDQLPGFEVSEEGEVSEAGNETDDFNGGGRDPLFREAAEIVVTCGQGSTSLLQRRMKIGFARAGRLMDQLEQAGIVGPSEGSKAREVLVTPSELDAVLQRLQ